MTAILWIAIGIYVAGFAFALWLNAMMGVVSLGLALLRAFVWPLWITTGIPEGRRL